MNQYKFNLENISLLLRNYVTHWYECIIDHWVTTDLVDYPFAWLPCLQIYVEIKSMRCWTDIDGIFVNMITVA